jgi:hypothetical protein
MPAITMAGIVILAAIKRSGYNAIIKAVLSGACDDIIRNND